MTRIRIWLVLFGVGIGLVALAAPRATAPAHAALFPTGIVGYSGNPETGGVICSVCHSGGIVPTVTLSGPTVVAPGETALYTLVISGGQEVAGGFNVSASDGFIATLPDATDTQTLLESITGRLEITHTAPKLVDANNEVMFELLWTAPSTPGTATLYGAGNSVNLAFGFIGDAPSSDSLTVTVEDAGSSGPNLVYFSLDGSGAIAGINYGPEDVLLYNSAGPSLNMVFDGSDVGLTGVNLDALDFLPDGRMLFSVDAPIALPGIGTLQPVDLAIFVGTFGDNTSGNFALAFDGSDVGLDDATENVDAFSLSGASQGVFSVADDYTLDAVTGGDTDLLSFVATSVGETTAGTWAKALDGPAVSLTANGTEDLDAAHLVSGELFLSTLGAFGVPDFGSGDSNDVFVCTPNNANPITDCTYAPDPFVDASQGGITQSIDALSLASSARPVSWPVPIGR